MFGVKETASLVFALAVGACNQSDGERETRRHMSIEAPCATPNLSEQEYGNRIIVVAEQAVEREGRGADIGRLLLECSPTAIDNAWNKVNRRRDTDARWTVLQVITRGAVHAEELRQERRGSI